MSADIFPAEVVEWRCPACGRRLNGQTYSIDELRAKCSKTWHKAMAVSCVYVRDITRVDELLTGVAA
jgi:hypothetical protein